jgi:histone-lysine N-methyltransferase SETMAR
MPICTLPPHTVESLRQLNFEVLKHPLYSPGLAPSNYDLFDPPKDTLRGCHFDINQEVKGAVHVWLVTQPKTFFSEGIQKLVDH